MKLSMKRILNLERKLLIHLTKSFLKKFNPLLNRKGSAIVSVVIASVIGTIVILGVGTSIVHQSTAQKKLRESNSELWKVMQIQSIVDRFANEDNSKNMDNNKKCLQILNDNISNKPSGFTFASRDCTAITDSELLDCQTGVPADKKPKIIYLKGVGTLDSNWDFKVPVKASQCCSLFYGEIIDKADGKSGLPANIQTKITDYKALSNLTAAVKIQKEKEIVDLIIADTTPLTYAGDVCGSVALDGGGSGDPECYKVTDASTGEFSLVGCGGTIDVNVNKHTAFGFEAGKLTTGSENTFFGYQAGRSNTTGYKNTFIGYQSGYKNTGGYYNNFIGYGSGYHNVTGSRNNFIGDNAGYRNTNGTYNNFIGYQSGFANTAGHNNNFIGNSAGYRNTNGTYNNFIGYQSGFANTAGRNNNFIGNSAGYRNTNGAYNNFIGYQSGFANTAGHNNNFIGNLSGYKNTTGNFNNFIGRLSGYRNTTGGHNNFMGPKAGYQNTVGIHNNLIGDSASSSNTTGNYNIAIGYRSGCQSFGCGSESYKLDIGGLIKGNMSGTKSVTIDGDLIIGKPSKRQSIAIDGDLVVSSVRSCNIRADANGRFGCPASDRRLKTKIKNLKKQLGSILKLNPKTFFWRDKNRAQTKQIGFIAQEVQKQYPELVSENSDKEKTLNLNIQGFIPIIIKSFKEFYIFTVKSLTSIKESVITLTKSIAFITKEMTKLKKTQLQTEKKLISANKKLERGLSSLKKENQSFKKDNKQLNQNLNSLIKRIENLEEDAT